MQRLPAIGKRIFGKNNGRRQQNIEFRQPSDIACGRHAIAGALAKSGRRDFRLHPDDQIRSGDICENSENSKLFILWLSIQSDDTRASHPDVGYQHGFDAGPGILSGQEFQRFGSNGKAFPFLLVAIGRPGDCCRIVGAKSQQGHGVRFLFGRAND